MKIENQVCSLELSKRLDELGVKVPSLFYHCRYGSEFSIYSWGNVSAGMFEEVYHAYSVAELGEMLLKFPGIYQYFGENKFQLHQNYRELECDIIASQDSNEANARAKMLIWLIEDGYVKVEELNHE